MSTALNGSPGGLLRTHRLVSFAAFTSPGAASRDGETPVAGGDKFVAGSGSGSGGGYEAGVRIWDHTAAFGPVAPHVSDPRNRVGYGDRAMLSRVQPEEVRVDLVDAPAVDPGATFSGFFEEEDRFAHLGAVAVQNPVGRSTRTGGVGCDQ